jgi:DNA mismatch repair ATPase MutS
VVLAALQLLGRVYEPYWHLPIAGALLLTLTAGRRATATFRRAGPGEELIEHYPELLKVAERASFSAALLSDIGSRIAVAGRPASRELERLAQLLHLADLRRSGMLYLPVQLLTLWDFHILNSLERWRRRAGSEVRGWLEAAGELEALASIAALAHDHPGWTFAEFTDSADAVIEGVGIGHPLIPEARRVDNDIRIGPPGTFLLVTGSNMSGKSTLLRAIGTNTVLARAGAPCCARRFRIPPVELWSCIRIDDSLAEGVSYFMAELKRLKEIVDAATRPDGAEGPTILFLIDEVLNGTNTAERQIAARRVIRHLVERGAIGVVTTHDLDLAQGPELAERAELVHFRETLTQNDAGRLEMTFDYQLRPGLATSTNALALLEFVGLPGE